MLLHKKDHNRRLHRRKACWNSSALFLVSAHCSSPLHPEVLPLHSQRNGTAFLLHLRFRFLLCLRADSMRCVSVLPFQALQAEKYTRRLCRPGRKPRSYFCQGHTLLPYLPVRFQVQQKGNPLLLWHISL